MPVRCGVRTQAEVDCNFLLRFLLLAEFVIDASERHVGLSIVRIEPGGFAQLDGCFVEAVKDLQVRCRAESAPARASGQGVAMCAGWFQHLPVD